MGIVGRDILVRDMRLNRIIQIQVDKNMKGRGTSVPSSSPTRIKAQVTGRIEPPTYIATGLCKGISLTSQNSNPTYISEISKQM